MAGQGGQGIEGADQYRDGHQLIGPARQAEEHIDKGVVELEAPFADVPQFSDQVKKAEKHQKRHQHQQGSQHDLPEEIALVGQGKNFLHRRKLNKECRAMRRKKSRGSRASMSRWMGHQAASKLILPWATQAWLTDSRLL